MFWTQANEAIFFQRRREEAAAAQCRREAAAAPQRKREEAATAEAAAAAQRRREEAAAVEAAAAAQCRREKAIENNWYFILGISASANSQQIKNAFRKCISKHHPDRFANMGTTSQQEATAKSQQINAAYEYAKSQGLSGLAM